MYTKYYKTDSASYQNFLPVMIFFQKFLLFMIGIFVSVIILPPVFRFDKFATQYGSLIELVLLEIVGNLTLNIASLSHLFSTLCWSDFFLHYADQICFLHNADQIWSTRQPSCFEFCCRKPAIWKNASSLQNKSIKALLLNYFV